MLKKFAVILLTLILLTGCSSPTIILESQRSLDLNTDEVHKRYKLIEGFERAIITYTYPYWTNKGHELSSFILARVF
jgi:hypothetical protein